MNLRTYLFSDGTTIPGLPRDAYTPGVPVVIDLDTMMVIPLETRAHAAASPDEGQTTAPPGEEASAPPFAAVAHDQAADGVEEEN